jgi:hypothetical protein
MPSGHRAEASHFGITARLPSSHPIEAPFDVALVNRPIPPQGAYSYEPLPVRSPQKQLKTCQRHLPRDIPSIRFLMISE